ncbi:MAG: hypothetical protein K6G03_10300 [Lachnospiraceae bacterium]|nr:hypothetical protein [Lachnospiraceae bacterium]
MKKFMKTMLAGFVAVILMTGCGKGNDTAAVTGDNSNKATDEKASEQVQQQEEQTAEEQTAAEQTAADKEADTAASDQTGNTYEDPKSLPEYTYQGSEKYLDVISEYLVASEKDLMKDDPADVYIPFSAIVQVDDKDPADIIAYGTYNIDGYQLLNTTLFSTTGSRSAGAFHLKTNEDGTYTVTKADLPLVYEDTEVLFASIPEVLEKINKLEESENDNLRGKAISEYVNSNNLYITQWQDHSHAPIQIEGAKETPEEAQFYTFESPFGYQITYDLRILALGASDMDDMYSKVEDEPWSGTLMVIKKAEGGDADAALTAELSNTKAGSVKGEAAELAGIPCSRVTYDEKLEDGRIFRYICYAVSANDNDIVIKLETTVEKGVSEMSVEELEKFFEPTLATFSMNAK